MTLKHVIFDHDGTLVNTSIAPRKIFPDIEDLLSFLRDSGISLYVWTARDRKSTKESLKSQGILHFFKELRCQGDAPLKPNTAEIEYMLDTDDQLVVMIGDSLSDIQAGKNIKAKTIAALWGFEDTELGDYFRQHGADELALSVQECKKILTKYIKE